MAALQTELEATQEAARDQQHEVGIEQKVLNRRWLLETMWHKKTTSNTHPCCASASLCSALRNSAHAGKHGCCAVHATVHQLPLHSFGCCSVVVYRSCGYHFSSLLAVCSLLYQRSQQVALLTTKLAAAESRLERLTSELQRRPAASAAAAMAEQIAALSALLGQQLEAEGWGQEAAAAAVLAAGGPGQLEPLLQVSLHVWSVCSCFFFCVDSSCSSRLLHWLARVQQAVGSWGP
jgi:hypothetical protein